MNKGFSRVSFRNTIDAFGGAAASYAVFFLTLIILLMRVAGLGPPMLFADEYYYASGAFSLLDRAYVPFFSQSINNYLYSITASIAYIGQGDVIVKARLLNAVFALMAVPPLLYMTRTWASTRLSPILVVSIAGLAVSGYAAYFMPETLYFTLYVYMATVFSMYFLNPSWFWLMSAAALHGALISVKPHGMFLLPAAAAVLMLCRPDGSLSWFKRDAAVRTVCYLIAAYACFVATSSFIARDLVVNPFGGGYGDFAGKVVDESGEYSRLLISAATIAISNSGVILLLGALPLVALMISTFWWIFPKQVSGVATASKGGAFHFFIVLCFAIMFIVAAAFSASMANGGQYESATRVHGRYFEVGLIVALVVGVCIASDVVGRLSVLGRFFYATAGVVSSVAGYWLLSKGAWQYSNDFAFGFSASNFPSIRMWVVAGVVGLGVVATITPRWLSGAMVVVLIGYLVSNAYFVDSERIGYGKSILDRYGEATTEPANGMPSIVVIFRSRDAEAFRAAFYMIGTGSMLEMQATSGLSCKSLSAYDTVITLQGIGESCGYAILGQEGSSYVLDAPGAPTKLGP